MTVDKIRCMFRFNMVRTRATIAYATPLDMGHLSGGMGEGLGAIKFQIAGRLFIKGQCESTAPLHMKISGTLVALQVDFQKM